MPFFLTPALVFRTNYFNLNEMKKYDIFTPND